MTSRDDDLETIAEILSGNERSFEKIVSKYQERVFRLCASMVGQSAAEDAAQEIFLKVFVSLRSFKGKSSFSTWLYRVASNHCLNLIRKEKKEKSVSLDSIGDDGGPPQEFSSHEPPIQESLEKKQVVRLTLDQLSPDERLILTLREMEGLSYGELADTLEISLQTVKIRLFRARRSFIKIAAKWM